MPPSSNNLPNHFLHLALLCCCSLWAGLLLAQPCRNVKNFGAKGDGIADDTEAIRKAFNTSPIPQCIYFPKGIYLIDPDSTPTRNMNVVKSNMIVKGDRGRSAIKIKDNSIIRRGGPVGNMNEQLLLGGWGPNIQKVTIQDLIFDCNYRGNEAAVNTVTTETRGITFEDAKELTIQNCVFLDAPMACLVLVRCQKNVLKDNYLYHIGQGKFNGDAIQVNGCTDSQITRNTLQNVGEGIFCQHHAPTRTRDSLAVISLNTIVTLDAGQAAAVTTYIHNSTLSKLKLGHLLNYNKPGKAIGAGIGILSNNSQVFNNNIVQHLGIAVQAYKGHGDLPTDSVVVRDNTILRNAKHSFITVNGGCKQWNANAAITISADQQTVKRIKIHNNRIVSSYNGGIQFVTDTSASVVPAIIQGVTVTQNSIINACLETCPDYKCAGIDFLNGSMRHNPKIIKRGQFIDITLRNNQIGYAHRYGIWLEPCTKSLSILQNQFNPGTNAVGPVNFADGSCIKQLQQPAFSTVLLNALQCILEPGVSPVGTCPTSETRKCVLCN